MDIDDDAAKKDDDAVMKDDDPTQTCDDATPTDPKPTDPKPTGDDADYTDEDAPDTDEDAVKLAHATGYIGTLHADALDGFRVWLSLTSTPDGADWVQIGQPRAWFVLQDSGVAFALMPLLLQALSEGLPVRITHDGAEQDVQRYHENDTFSVLGVRVLRKDLRF